jgi:hypothetical protein
MFCSSGVPRIFHPWLISTSHHPRLQLDFVVLVLHHDQDDHTALCHQRRCLTSQCCLVGVFLIELQREVLEHPKLRYCCLLKSPLVMDLLSTTDQAATIVSSTQQSSGCCCVSTRSRQACTKLRWVGLGTGCIFQAGKRHAIQRRPRLFLWYQIQGGFSYWIS